VALSLEAFFNDLMYWSDGLFYMYLGKMSVSFSSYTQSMCCEAGKESPELFQCVGFLIL